MAIDDPRNIERMKRIQREVEQMLLRANTDDKVEAAIAAFALIRVARTLLDRYPKKVSAEFARLAQLYLERADVVLEQDPHGKYLLHG